MKTQPSILPRFTQPVHPILQRFISYYYFSQSSDDSYFNEFYFYPHYKTTISIYQGAMARWTDTSSDTIPIADKDQINSYYSSIIKNRFNVKTTGSFKKIGIVFNALGFNQFIDDIRMNVAPNQIVELIHYGDEFTQLCEDVFNMPDPDKKTTLLDSFFLSRLHAQRDGLIEEAVNLIFDEKKERSIKDIAGVLQIDRKTLYKLFKNHLCCTPSAFRRVVRFRQAIEQYINTQEHIKLCELAYDNYFYDQAHFIRTTKQFTEENPKLFFKSITKVGPSDTYWSFQNENLK